MKKISFILTFFMSIFLVLTSCSFSTKYNKQEEEIINFVNSQIETKYGVKIDRRRYDYSVAKEVEENKFKKIRGGEKLKVVGVSAMLKGKPKKGEVIYYSLLYDVETKEIIQINADIY